MAKEYILIESNGGGDMRRFSRIISILILLFCATAIFAADSDYFVKTVPIIKVYLHKLGFRVVYWKSDLTFGTFHVPIEWFGSSADSKAEAVYGSDRSYPYFSIFWKEGEFDHIRFYLIQNKNHESWGDLPNTAELNSKFENLETLDLEF
jgi:hypothetical protein